MNCISARLVTGEEHKLSCAEEVRRIEALALSGGCVKAPTSKLPARNCASTSGSPVDVLGRWAQQF